MPELTLAFASYTTPRDTTAVGFNFVVIDREDAPLGVAAIDLMLVAPEPGFERLVGALLGAEAVLVPASCLSRRRHGDRRPKGSGQPPEIDALLERLRARLLPFSEAHACAAADAFLCYGKGRHPAGLNFGDCIAYAVAKVEGRALLFAGGDFARTDVAAAVGGG